MATRSNLVNLQYNSPIRLYSQQNINDTLNKQSSVLANGALGIDFHNLAKPGNLAHSQVLKMVEEEETGRSGRYSGPGVKRVAWPPPPGETNGLVESSEPTFPQGSLAQGAGVERADPRGQGPPQGIRAVQPAVQKPPIQKAPSPYRPVEPPKATVTLLPVAPVRQQPSPVFASQPVAASVMGGNRMRGDEKWPPESVKQQTEAENAARVALAKGPTCRPRKVKKDYSGFFAQHALTPTYPSYKAPPGTQHYIEEGTSNL